MRPDARTFPSSAPEYDRIAYPEGPLSPAHSSYGQPAVLQCDGPLNLAVHIQILAAGELSMNHDRLSNDRFEPSAGFIVLLS